MSSVDKQPEAALLQSEAGKLGSSVIPEGYVMVPASVTEEMRRACWRQQYVFHGATPEEAAQLAEAKVIDAKQRANDEEGYCAMISAGEMKEGDTASRTNSGGSRAAPAKSDGLRKSEGES